MEVGSWYKSGSHHQNVCWGQTDYDAIVNSLSAVTSGAAAPAGSLRATVPIWRLLWRRIKRQKRRIFEQYYSNSARFSYDPCDYAQNFDQGLMWNNSDDLSRSFSARFAVPSRVLIFHNNNEGLMV